MTELITIDYIPLIKGNIHHERKLSLNINQILGMMIMAAAITDPSRITIKLGNGDIADITAINNLPYYGNHPESYDYTANFGQYNVSFSDPDVIQGALQICLILGVDPSIITDVKYRNILQIPDFHRYFGMLSIPNFTEYPDGTSIEINSLKEILPSEFVDSLTKSLTECFPEVSGLGIIVPGEMYMICTDANRSEVAASAAATTYLPNELNQYAYLKAYYIFSVCSGTEFRGQGLAKSLMILMLNDLIGRGHNNFLLEVLPSNVVAYTLYASMGFQKIAVTSDGHVNYDLLYLQME